MQIDEHAPAAVKEALDSGDLSINQGYNITRQVRELPEEQRNGAAAMVVEIETPSSLATCRKRSRIGIYC